MDYLLNILQKSMDFSYRAFIRLHKPVSVYVDSDVNSFTAVITVSSFSNITGVAAHHTINRDGP